MGIKGQIPWNLGKKGCQVAWNKGKRMSEEFRQKMRTASSWYKGGKSSLEKRIKMSIEWKLWREAVFVRDNYTCQECRKHSGNGKRVTLHPHHILSFSEYPEHRFNIANGTTLCKECHHKTDNYGSKQYREKLGELLGSPERVISSQARGERYSGRFDGQEVSPNNNLPLSAQHESDDMTCTAKELAEVGNRKPTITYREGSSGIGCHSPKGRKAEFWKTQNPTSLTISY